MRILLISNLFPPEFIGGYELVAADVATRLQRDGHEVMVLTSLMIGETPEANWPFCVSRTLQCLKPTLDLVTTRDVQVRGNLANIGNMKVIANALRSFQPTVVFCFNLAGLGPYGVLKLLDALNINPVLYLGDNVFDNGFLDQTEWTSFLRFIDFPRVMSNVALLPVSNRVLKEVGDYLSLELAAKMMVPGWVDEAVPLQVSERALGTPESPIRYIFSSRIAPHKGTEIVLDAVSLLKQRGDRHFVVDLYGPGEVASLMQRVHFLGLQDIIRYRGVMPKETMLQLYGTYDALLFPTWEREPFGFVAAEAAYNGCIPIMTRTCGAAEWFLDGVNSIKIEREPDALAAAMQRFHLMSLDDRRKMEQQTKRAGQIMFGFSRWSRKICSVLEAAQQPSRTGEIANIMNALTLQFKLFFRM